MLKKFIHRTNDFAKSSKLRKNNEDFSVDHGDGEDEQEDGDTFYSPSTASSSPYRPPAPSNYGVVGGDNYYSSRLSNNDSNHPSTYPHQSNYYKYDCSSSLLIHSFIHTFILSKGL